MNHQSFLADNLKVARETAKQLGDSPLSLARSLAYLAGFCEATVFAETKGTPNEDTARNAFLDFRNQLDLIEAFAGKEFRE